MTNRWLNIYLKYILDIKISICIIKKYEYIEFFSYVNITIATEEFMNKYPEATKKLLKVYINCILGDSKSNWAC